MVDQQRNGTHEKQRPGDTDRVPLEHRPVGRGFSQIRDEEEDERRDPEQPGRMAQPMLRLDPRQATENCE